MEAPGRTRPSRWFAVSIAFAASTASGCSFFFARPESQYVDRERVLEAVAEASGFEPDGAHYRLRYAEVSPDLNTLHYQGVAHPGDRAWVTIFSQKEAEQRPDDLSGLDGVLAAILEGKDGFRLVERTRRDWNGISVEIARYRFQSPLRGVESGPDGRQTARPVEASGVAAALRADRSPAPVIYHINAVNIEGDRTDLGWNEIEPFLRAISP